MIKKPYKVNGLGTLMLPRKHCVFCEHCTDIWWDYTHGIYGIFCDIDANDQIESIKRPDFECKNFIEEGDTI